MRNLLFNSFDYSGKYIKEIKTQYSTEKWVYIPKDEVYFLHKATLFGDDILAGVFTEDNIIYLMCWLMEDNKDYYKCALEFVRKSDYIKSEDVKTDKKINKNEYEYYEMDSIFYNRWCTMNR